MQIPISSTHGKDGKNKKVKQFILKAFKGMDKEGLGIRPVQGQLQPHQLLRARPW